MQEKGLLEMLRYATGVGLIKNSEKLGICEHIVDVEQKPYDGFLAEIILHSEYPLLSKGGVLR